jgi:predicted nucleic acid-binding protein
LISIDSYGWIERFTDGPKAKHYNAVIDQRPGEEIVTAPVILYEVYRRIKQFKGEEMALESVAALSGTNVVSLDQTISLEAADFSFEHHLHMADALVYATARHYDAELYTCDEDLRKLRSVTFI